MKVIKSTSPNLIGYETNDEIIPDTIIVLTKENCTTKFDKIVSVKIQGATKICRNSNYTIYLK